LEQVQGVLTEFSRVEAGLAALRERHGNTVYEVTTTAGMDAAKAARAEIREPRFAVEKVRKAAKAPLLELGRRIDAEAIRITEAILAIEEPIDDQIKAEEARKAAEKEAKRAAEVERLRLEAAAKLKAEEDRLATERAEIVRQQAAVAAERAKAEAEAAAERKKIDAEAAAARRKAEADMAKAEAQMAAERAKLAAERARADEQAAAERARIKAERDAVEAAAANLAREQAAEADRVAKVRAEEERRQQAEAAKPADDQGNELPAKALFLIPPYFQLVVAVADVFSVPHEVADGWIKHYQNPPLDAAN
jgi:hypothetical protein